MLRVGCHVIKCSGFIKYIYCCWGSQLVIIYGRFGWGSREASEWTNNLGDILVEVSSTVSHLHQNKKLNRYICVSNFIATRKMNVSSEDKMKKFPEKKLMVRCEKILILSRNIFKKIHECENALFYKCFRLFFQSIVSPIRSLPNLNFDQ
jgi:hypothetical protein